MRRVQCRILVSELQRERDPGRHGETENAGSGLGAQLVGDRFHRMSIAATSPA